MKTYRIDIDGTIATPRFFHEAFEQCACRYIQEGIVTHEEIASLRFHQQLFLLPQVLLTHQPIEGAVHALQKLHTQGMTLQYFTMRQNFNPVLREHVHSNTCVWLEQQQFPYPMQTRFFWDAGEKLLAALEAPEEEVIVVDDRPAGLVKAYEQIAGSDPEMAQHIKQRLTFLAFGYEHLEGLPTSDLRMIPLANWSLFPTVFHQGRTLNDSDRIRSR